MSQSEFNPAPATARAGQVWRTEAGGLYTIPCDINPLGFDLVEMVRDEDGFTIWRGGACPVPHTSRVEALFRGGDSTVNSACYLDWSHGRGAWDIVAYKVVDERVEVNVDPGSDTGDHTVIATMYAVSAAAAKDDREYTGGKVNYYEVKVESPTRDGRAPYTAECNDIIEALGMSFAEGEAFKAIWRGAAARKNLAKRGYTDGLYDAEKVQFYGGRMVAQEKSRREKSSSQD